MIVRRILFGIGVLALLAGIALSVVWLNRPAGAPAEAAVEHSAVLVAAHQITTGSLLRLEDMVWKDVALTEVLPINLVRGQATEAEFVGAAARHDVAPGEALVASDLVKPNDRGFLSAVLAPGDRAVSIAVDASQSNAGLVMPGDHVDIVLTQSFADAVTDAAHRTVSETVLHDIRVIAVDQTLSALAKPSSIVGSVESRLPKTVTLEVSQRDAERVFVATQLGKLGLTVRALDSASDLGSGATAVQQSPLWASEVSPALKALSRSPEAAPATATPRGRPPVQVMRGAKTDAQGAAADSSDVHPKPEVH
jgi:pilus assembly protein CpaB